MTKKEGERLMVPTRRGMSRGDFLKVGGAGLAGAALLGVAGCGGEPEPVEFNFSFGHDPTGTVQELVARFNENEEFNKGRYRANYLEMSSDSGQYLYQLIAEFKAGSGDVTLIGGDVIWPTRFAANGWIIDLSDRFPESERRKFFEAQIESNEYGDAIYGVPWFTDAGILYYRKDLLEQPPETWEELKEMAGKVKEDFGTEFGFVFQGRQYEGGVVNALEYIYSYGGQVLDPDDASKVVIEESTGSAEGLEMGRSMIVDGIAPEEVTNYKEQDCESAFLNDRAVFCRHWPSMYKQAYDLDSTIEPEQIGVAPLPAGREGSVSVLGGWNFYINANSDLEAQNAAYEFVKFATDSEWQRFWATEGGFVPSLKNLRNDPRIKEEVPVIRKAGEALDKAEPRPVSPYYSEMSREMAEQFSLSLRGDVEPEQAVATLQQELENIIDRKIL